MTNQTHIEVPITASTNHLSERERIVLKGLVEIAKAMDDVFLAQEKTPSYPADLTVEEFKKYVAEHPDEAGALESPFTIVERRGDKLVAVEYAEAYAEPLGRAVGHIADIIPFVFHPGLNEFLISRAASFATNDFDVSDELWITRFDGAPFEATIGPYEEYRDTLLGLKRDFEGVIGVVVPEEQERLRLFQEECAGFDHALSKKYGHMVSGASKNMTVVDQVISTGHSLRSGYTPMAYNLPNTESIRKRVGSRQVFLRNVMDAKFANITMVIADRVASRDICQSLSSNAYLRAIVGHELCHGIGIYCKPGLNELGHALEEAKADVFGLLFLFYLADKGLIDLELAYASAEAEMVDKVRQLRFNATEAHAFGSRIQYQWFLAARALSLSDGRISVVRRKIRAALESLGDEFARLAFAADYELARAFVDKWGGGIDGFDRIVDAVKDVPVDIKPIHSV